jgi:hypothetical protein
MKQIQRISIEPISRGKSWGINRGKNEGENDHPEDVGLAGTVEDWLWAVALVLFIATWVIAAIHP